MTFRRVLTLAALVLIAVPWASAQAGWRIGIGIGLPVYRPAPRVYVVPGPYYVQPAPVYVQPAPVYVQPAPAYVQPVPVAPAPAPVAPPAVPQTSQYLPPQPVPIQ
jgi:PXPV repeat (3 copies)